jgi:FKBP-type peptidyl-prolyl cis-trans isomerase FklB
MDKKDAKQRLSYAVGVQIAGNLKQSGFEELEPVSFTEGILDILNDSELQISFEEVQAEINAHYEKFQATAKEQNSEAGKIFLEKNKEKEGVVVLPSGLQYRVISKGDGKGEKPTEKDMVTTHYEGKTIDGKVFDSSFQRGEPASFPVNGVIKGWTEALQLMHVGDKFELFVPSELAYGEQGAGQDIPPYSTLIFDVELLKVN